MGTRCQSFLRIPRAPSVEDRQELPQPLPRWKVFMTAALCSGGCTDTGLFHNEDLPAHLAQPSEIARTALLGHRHHGFYLLHHVAPPPRRSPASTLMPSLASRNFCTVPSS